MIVVTGASQNHYNTLMQFIDCFFKFYPESESSSSSTSSSIKLIVYNLGINDQDWDNLKQKYESKYSKGCIEYKIFNFSIYPDYVNINVNAGEYAWKPIIIYDTSIE